jgi:hypothetical protein
MMTAAENGFALKNRNPPPAAPKVAAKDLGNLALL